MNKFCFGAIYNGRLWEKELRVPAHKNSYRHDRRADKNPYRHDRRADKNPYRHDRRADSQCQLR